ncbi:hypothetical protein LIER_40335 [Lithospermum erythrorhizon]|uniref:Uncharacterized protein n=1 Tax=Lithospermum erythrorhizon TaxID=34254 RepID=A0AAV3QSZ8_LITER
MLHLNYRENYIGSRQPSLRFSIKQSHGMTRAKRAPNQQFGHLKEYNGCGEQNTEEIPRYCLKLEATNDDHLASLVLFGEAATMFIGSPVTEFVDTINKDHMNAVCYQQLGSSCSKEYKFYFKRDNTTTKDNKLSTVVEPTEMTDHETYEQDNVKEIKETSQQEKQADVAEQTEKAKNKTTKSQTNSKKKDQKTHHFGR